MKKIDQFQRWQIFVGAIGIVFSCVAGWWSYTNFVDQRIDARNLSLEIRGKEISAQTETSLFSIEAVIKNIGRVPVAARDRGIELTVIEYVHPMETAASNGNVIDWYRNDRDVRFIVDRYNLLQGYNENVRAEYLLNPGVEFREVVIVPLDYGKLYAVRVRFFVANDGGTMSDFKYFYPTK